MPVKILPLNQHQVRITEHEGQIVDIEVLIDEKQRHDFLQKFPAHDVHWQTSCYSYLLHNGLAKYNAEKEQHKSNATDAETLSKEARVSEFMKNLQSIIAGFADLERFINNPPSYEYSSSLDALTKAVDDYEQGLINNHLFNDLPTKLLLETNIKKFRENIEKLKDKVPTPRQLRKLFSVQDESPDIQSLGGFVAQQMYDLLGGSIEHLYDCTGDRVKQLLAMHPAIKVLSDIKSDVRKKGLTLHGARYNNSYSSIPREMLDVMSGFRPTVIAPAAVTTKQSNGVDEKHTQTLEATVTHIEPVASAGNTQKWLSLKSYVDLSDPESVDKALCHLANINVSKPAKSWKQIFMQLFESATWKKAGKAALKYVANVVELGFTFLRFVPATVSFVLGCIPTKTTQKWSKAIDNFAAEIHNKFSLVRWAKNYEHEDYVCQGDNNNEREAILAPIKYGARSLYNDVFTEYLSGNKVAEALRKTVKQGFLGIKNVFKDAWGMLKSGVQTGFYKKEELTADVEQQRQVAFNEMQKQVDASFEKMQVDLRDRLNKLTNKNSDSATNSIASTSQPLLPNAAAGAADVKALTPSLVTTEEKWTAVKNWQANEFTSVFDFFDEIVVGLADVVIDPMFRKSPGAATAFFILANASLGTLMVAGGSSAPMAAFLKAVPAWLSKKFTGKEVTESSMAKIIAVFLEWKLGFFGSEFIIEMGKGDFTFLNDLFKEPEKITFGLFTLIAAGVALQFIPALPTTITIHGKAIPNPYAEAINIFTEEARTCAQGQVPFTFIEYAFLALKFGLLTESLLSGTHTLKTQPINIKKLARDLQNLKFTDAISNEDKKTILIKALAQQGKMRNEGEDKQFDVLVSKFLVEANKITATNAAANLISQFSAVAPPVMSPAPKPVVVSARLAVAGDVKVAVADKAVDNEVTPLQAAWKKLSAAVSLVKNMDLMGEKFTSIKKAQLFYDYLDGTFENYNKQLKNIGRLDQQVEKQDFLHSFYNKHCYQGSTTLWRVTTLVLAWPWRAIKYGIASTERFHSPSTLHQVKKSFNKDAAMATQIFAMGGLVAQAATRAYAYTARFLVNFIGNGFGVGVGIYALIAGVGKAKNWIKAVDKFSTKIAPHRATPFNSNLKIKYAEWTREAGTIDDLSTQCARLGTELAAKDPSKVDYTQHKTANDKLAAFKPVNSKQQKILQRLSAVVNDSKITKDNRSELIRRITAEDPAFKNLFEKSPKAAGPVSAVVSDALPPVVVAQAPAIPALTA